MKVKDGFFKGLHNPCEVLSSPAYSVERWRKRFVFVASFKIYLNGHNLSFSFRIVKEVTAILVLNWLEFSCVFESYCS